MHEVVDFCAAANACFADGGTVDCGVGADFDVIFENDNSGLNDLVIRAVVLFGISEPISTDLRPILKNDVVAKHAELANGDVRIGLEVVANTNTAADMDKGVNRTVASNLNVILDHHIRADGSSFSNLCRRRNDRCGIDSARCSRSLTEEFDRTRERQIWIRAPECRYGNFRKVGGHDYGTRFGRARLGGVLGIRNKCQVAGARLIDSHDPRDFRISVAIQDTVQPGRNVG